MNKETNLGARKKSRGLPLGLLFTIIGLLAAGGAFMVFRDMTPPTITIGPDMQQLGKASSLTISAADPGSGLKSIEIVLVQNDKRTTLLSKTYTGPVKQVEEIVPLDAKGIKEGDLTIAVTAQDNSIYPFGAAGLSKAEKAYILDTTPPRIFVQSHTNNLNQGGCGLMIFALSEQASVAGIQVGERFFPAYLQPGGNGKFEYYCMFAHPWDVKVADFKPMIIATDAAGNNAKRSFNYHTNARTFRHDRINLSDRFMEKTIPEFQGLVPDEGTLIDQYLYINNEIRKQNRAKLIEFSRSTSPVMLWNGTFSRLPNAANRARFADSRDYMYKGKKVDFQTHLGLDLASLRQAPVPAGNDGTIVFADFLGIYGNVVVIDHGLGLQSLYAHLSSVAVTAGETVTKGQIIGNTGTTGLAGGDHLHYGITVAGIPTQPFEWWDASWIKNNITSKLQ